MCGVKLAKEPHLLLPLPKLSSKAILAFIKTSSPFKTGLSEGA